jgi:hypothetical protein
MERKNKLIYALDNFVKKVGIPEILLCDNDATMEMWSEWKKRVRKYSIDLRYTEPYSPFQYKAELDIQMRRFQEKTRSPQRLWNYLVHLCARIRSFVAGTHPDLQGRYAFELVHGWTPDISLYVMHGWYKEVSFLDHDNKRKLACWSGQAEDYGGGDAAFLLPKSAKPMVRSMFWSLSQEERAVCYPLWCSSLTRKQFDTVQRKAMAILTARSGFNRNTRKEILYGPLDLGGANFRHLHVEQGGAA